MIALMPVGSNQTELKLNNGTVVFFSYQTPVGARIANEYYKTTQKYSRTTSKHLSRWAGENAIEKPQSFFDNLAA